MSFYPKSIFKGYLRSLIIKQASQRQKPLACIFNQSIKCNRFYSVIFHWKRINACRRNVCLVPATKFESSPTETRAPRRRWRHHWRWRHCWHVIACSKPCLRFLEFSVRFVSRCGNIIFNLRRVVFNNIIMYTLKCILTVWHLYWEINNIMIIENIFEAFHSMYCFS